MTDKNTKSEVKSNVSKTSKKVSEVKEEKQKIRSFRNLKLKVLKGQSKLTLAKQDLEELEIISKTYKK